MIAQLVDVGLGNVCRDPHRAQVGQHEQNVVHVGLLAEDRGLFDDRAVERSRDPVERDVFIASDRVGDIGVIEQTLNVFRDAQDPQPLAGVDDGRLGEANGLERQALFLRRIELNLLDRGLELGLNPLAGVPRHERRVLPNNVLGKKVRLFLLFMAGDVKLGVGLQQGAAIRAELLARKLLLDHAGVGRRACHGRLGALLGRLINVLVIGSGASPLVDALFQLGNQQGDVRGDFRLPLGIEPRR